MVYIIPILMTTTII